MAFSGKFLGVQDTLQTNFGSGIHTLAEVGQGVKDGVWPTNYKINQSLRLGGSYLSIAKDYATTTATFSFWVKPNKVADGHIYQARSSTSTNVNRFYVNLTGTSAIRVAMYDSSQTLVGYFTSSDLFRDFSAWYHIVISLDTTQSIESNRITIYVNNRKITDFSDETYPSQNFNIPLIDNPNTNIGRNVGYSTADYYGYIAEFNFIDGLALNPTYFGSTNPITKKWSPKRYTGEYGSNGFYLDFAGKNVGTGAVGTVGEDKSGNGNHFTSTNVSSHDVVPDSPTNNFATLNSTASYQEVGSNTISDGNLKVEGSSGYGHVFGTLVANSSTPFYFEVCHLLNDNHKHVGVATVAYASDVPNLTANYNVEYGIQWQSSTSKWSIVKEASSPISIYNQINDAAYDVIGVYIYNGIAKYWINGTSVLKSASVDYFVGPIGDWVVSIANNTGNASTCYLNAGQDATFGGNKTPTKVYTDANGRGQFFYEPPAGALALCSANLEQAKNTPTEYITDETDQHRLTYTGNARVSKFSPYAQDGYSINVNTSSEYLTLNSSSSILSQSDWTVEFWIYPMSWVNYQGLFGASQGGGAQPKIAIQVGLPNLQLYLNGVPQGSIPLPNLNQWTFMSFSRSSASGKLIVHYNGVKQTDVSFGTQSISANFQWFTNGEGATSGFYGYLTDGRISDIARYDLTDYNAPTQALTADANTLHLLSINEKQIKDKTNSYTITATGSPEISDWSPFSPDPNTVTQDLTLNGGGSFQFDGLPDKLQVPDSNDWNPEGQDFTVEGWYYLEQTGAFYFMWGTGGSDGNEDIAMRVNTNNTITAYLRNSAGTQNLLASTNTVVKNTWNHIALERYNNVIKIYLNGVAESNTFDATSWTGYNSETGFSVGAFGDYTSGGFWNGYIADFRFVKGSAVYQGNFTPPTAPLTAVTNTKLLLQPYSKVKPSKGIFNRTDAYPYDETEKSLTYVNGASVIDTSPYKSGDIGSFSFIRSNLSYIESLSHSDFTMSSGDFTFEQWLKIPANVGSNSGDELTWFGQNADGGGTTNSAFVFLVDTGNVIKQSIVDSTPTGIELRSDGAGADTPFTYTAGEWFHTAFVRNGNTLSLYLNGILSDHVDITGKSVQTSTLPWVFGRYGSYSSRYFDGLVCDFRAISGQALYTASFTPPAYPLRSDYYTTDGSDPATSGTRSAISGTVALFAQPGKKEDKSEVFKFASLNKNNYSGTSITLANNGYSVTSTTAQSVHSSFSVSSGKWYVEASGTAGTAGGYIGVQEANTASPAPTYGVTLSNLTAQGIGLWTPAGYIYGGNGTSSFTGISAPGTALTGTDVVAMAIDMDASPKTVQWLVNNTRVITVKLGSTEYIAADGTTGTATATFADISNLYVTYNGGGASTKTADWNFGQDPTILGNVTPSGGTNADNGFPDEDGNGSFRYAPPSGYKAMGKYEKPAKLVSDPALHPEKYFNTVLYSGTGGTQSITGLGFQPDFVWLKTRSGLPSSQHYVYDVVRGAGEELYPNSTNVENYYTYGELTSFDTDGFTVYQSGTGNEINYSGVNYVAWCWKAGGEPVPNTDGTIPALVSANKDAGFSIVKYSSTGTVNSTVPHGLNQKPELIIIKNLDATSAWLVVGENITYYMNLDTVNADPSSTGYSWVTLRDSNIFKLGSTRIEMNTNNNDYIAYCWHSVPGFSKFGSYTGNGNADGPFVYTGFKPAWLMIKRTDTTGNWAIVDNARNEFNITNKRLFADDTAVESTLVNVTDFTSNGFKIRDSAGSINDGTVPGTYIYAAFAESPFSRSTAR